MLKNCTLYLICFHWLKPIAKKAMIPPTNENTMPINNLPGLSFLSGKIGVSIT
jgi:hypothetical protein